MSCTNGEHSRSRAIVQNSLCAALFHPLETEVGEDGHLFASGNSMQLQHMGNMMRTHWCILHTRYSDTFALLAVKWHSSFHHPWEPFRTSLGHHHISSHTMTISLLYHYYIIATSLLYHYYILTISLLYHYYHLSFTLCLYWYIFNILSFITI